MTAVHLNYAYRRLTLTYRRLAPIVRMTCTRAERSQSQVEFTITLSY